MELHHSAIRQKVKAVQQYRATFVLGLSVSYCCWFSTTAVGKSSATFLYLGQDFHFIFFFTCVKSISDQKIYVRAFSSNNIVYIRVQENHHETHALRACDEKAKINPKQTTMVNTPPPPLPQIL